jgi:NADP-dependent 3-hydroxy acid dehydrogenase YdfG
MEEAATFSDRVGNGGRIDIVVVNAGRGLAGGVMSSEAKEWQALYELNVLGAADLMRRAGEAMVKQKSGDIVVLGSVSGHNISPFSGFYGSTKWALASMAEAMRREVCGSGVRVTVVKPAVVMSEFQENAGYTKENFFKTIEKYGKVLGPEDVARVIGFVVSQPAHVHVNELIVRPTGQDYP